VRGKTVLFVGAGRHQRRAIGRVQELGVRVVAVDGNAEAPGLALADAGETVDFTDIDAVAAVGRAHSVDGVLTVAADRAVPVVAAVAERLGLPGIGSETAHLATNKIAMRRVFADRGVPQPQFAGVRHFPEVKAAARAVGFPAVLKPADSAGQRGIFLVRSADELAAQLVLTIAASPTEEAIVERYHEGREVNTLLVARDGEVRLLTASDRIRPDGAGFGVALAHLQFERSASRTASPIRSCSYLHTTTRCSPWRSQRESPPGRWTRCRATASGSISSRSRCSRRSARRCRTSS
jgi:biotin carboxylase